MFISMPLRDPGCSVGCVAQHDRTSTVHVACVHVDEIMRDARPTIWFLLIDVRAQGGVGGGRERNRLVPRPGIWRYLPVQFIL